MSAPDFNDPLHVKTHEPCEWCGAEWGWVDGGWTIDHSSKCEYIIVTSRDDGVPVCVHCKRPAPAGVDAMGLGVACRTKPEARHGR